MKKTEKKTDMIKTIEGNLFMNIKPCSVILHQVNCLGVAGAGFARMVKDAYPGWFGSYFECCRTNRPEELLGTYHVYDVGESLKICSAFCQAGIGKERRQTDYDAWKKALPRIDMQLRARLKAGEVWTVLVPYGIGCGLGGGDWSVMSDLFEFLVGDSPVEYRFCRFCRG